MNQELQIGSFGLSVLLSIVLRMIYSTVEIPGKYKPWIAVVAGIGLALIAMVTMGTPYDTKTVINYITQGFMTGATATGLYEMTKTKEPTA
jgi:ABC-type antimicrobial peptide transport system permease subunit